MGINFPASPVIGQFYPDPALAGIPQYRWDGTVWEAQFESPVPYVRKSGDTMTGLLTLSGDPTAALHAVPRQYAVAKAGEP